MENYIFTGQLCQDAYLLRTHPHCPLNGHCISFYTGLLKAAWGAHMQHLACAKQKGEIAPAGDLSGKISNTWLHKMSENMLKKSPPCKKR